MDKLCDLLREDGHSCMSISGMSNHKFKWCQKEVCSKTEIRNDMARRNASEQEFADKLRREGHRCIRIMESFPIQVGWCQKTPCKKA